MDTASIIDQCLRGIGEETPAAPVGMTRADCLSFINLFYQNHIGKRLKALATYSYDASDTAHTLTAGVATLPSDFLAPVRVYDGDTPANDPLDQIYDIEDKVSDTSSASQFMIPDLATLWVFGKTPTNPIKLYYYKKPAALTDSAGSTPTALKEEFHLEPFVKVVQKIYATRNGDYGDEINLELFFQDILDSIERAHRLESKGMTSNRVRANRYV